MLPPNLFLWLFIIDYTLVKINVNDCLLSVNCRN